MKLGGCMKMGARTMVIDLNQKARARPVVYYLNFLNKTHSHKSVQRNRYDIFLAKNSP